MVANINIRKEVIKIYSPKISEELIPIIYTKAEIKKPEVKPPAFKFKL